ncbi:Putative signal transducing protein [Pricia antarctica]|uniref:Putative signal transducing protein n=1 Tax=Pricia antarctica TaxID=641691 RepID=A0A1G7E9F4_9FLAO|nr:DUF2007 domain-containing protein [Pricia antarctica]SDE60015.1 Putative signal transducing protein [Pricia antarctica]
MSSDYIKIYTGNPFITQLIVSELREMGIEPIVKDESESARLAGFAANIDGDREIHVNNDEAEKALAGVKRVLADNKE